MSSIGIEEEVAAHDELILVSVSGGPGFVYDCDGDKLFLVPERDIEAVAAIFPLVVRAYRTGQDHGEKAGRAIAQSAMRKALGL